MTRTAPDIGLLRFLRARVDETVVLNEEPASRGLDQPPAIADAGPSAVARMPGASLAGTLMLAARRLVPERAASLAYGRIASSPEFAAYRELTRALHDFEPATLEGRAERTAFWINLFNALVIDAVVTFGVRESIRETPGFFRRAAYRVGPHRFALDEIEHGLLRANRPQHPRLPPPFRPGDSRARLGPGVLDPRIHFALNCGTRSCPPVAFYEASRLDEQLDAAASSFINAEGVRIVDGEAVISPLFEFYCDDFGGPDGIVSWLMRYVTDERCRHLLTRGRTRPADYDWSLNDG
jgi:hypothetical protein